MLLTYVDIEDLHLLIFGIEIIILYTTIQDTKYCRWFHIAPFKKNNLILTQKLDLNK